MSVDPIFNNPPAFVLLAGLVGLGAYLRGLGETSLKLIEEIEKGKIEDFPMGAAHTEEKLKHLHFGRKILNSVVATYVIWLTVSLVYRLTWLAWTRLKFPDDPQHSSSEFRYFDFYFMLLLFVLFLGLGIMHYWGRIKDKQIRLKFAGWKDRQKQAEATSAQPPPVADRVSA